MSNIIEFKALTDDLEIQYEVISPIDVSSTISKDQANIIRKLSNIEDCLAENQKIIDGLNEEIDRLTNKADGLDYTIAVASGILTGLIDAFFVGELNFTELKADANKHVNKFIEKYAKLRGYEDKGQGLKGAISFLEKHFPVDQDNVWKGLGISSANLHHLEDLAHHPTIPGLIASVGVVYFRTALFVDTEGESHFILLETNKNNLIKVWAPIVISGVLRWLVYLAESKYQLKNSKELPKPLYKLLVALSYSPAIIEVLKVTDNWFGHLVSDMGGSINTAGGGRGIPGIFVSLLKEISSLPILKDTNLPLFVKNLYSKDKWDLRSEMAFLDYVGKQSIPVILNELLVRTFYFVRHLITEHKNNNGWKNINWSNVIPWRNRTIERMITIASGTFVVVDAADAAIRAALKSGGEPATFFSNMVLRINFVGVGRFAIAICNDMYMGYQRNKLRNERMYRQSEQIFLSTAKVYYKQADMWMTAKTTAETIEQMEKTATEAICYFRDSLYEMSIGIEKIVILQPEIKKYNPGLLDEISNKLKYGK